MTQDERTKAARRAVERRARELRQQADAAEAALRCPWFGLGVIVDAAEYSASKLMLTGDAKFANGHLVLAAIPEGACVDEVEPHWYPAEGITAA